MSTFANGTRVLVTGATGYIGAHVVDQFLQAGFVVVGTSRSAIKAQKTESYFKNRYGDGRFEIYEAGDLEEKGVFDEAVKDVEIIAHLASPVNFFPKDPIHDVVNPAIRGTLSLLNSAHKYGKNVKHVILTSSMAAVLDFEADPSHAFNEEDWNDGAMVMLKQCQETGQAVEEGVAYMASKNESEKALWQFREEKRPSFFLTTLLPSWVFGTIIPPPATDEEAKASISARQIIEYFSGENQDASYAWPIQAWVNVTDVARAHLLVIQNAAKTDGQRYVVNAGSFSFQEVVDILRETFPEREHVITKGETGKYPEQTRLVDGSKIKRELGLYYSDFKETIVENIKGVEHIYKLKQQ
ncbi:hypothetical protein NQZ79_g5905 [Umbelopsis isabellina]|nr:hypothetical protein NQZ79_g5905 [Umbelopsis isabellina]